MKKLKDNKIFKIVKTILNVLIGAFLVMFFVVVCLQRFSNNRIAILNYRMFTVASGSMKPRYDIGDVLISKEIDTGKIKVGDTVSYLGKSGDFKDKVITHEVIAIEEDSDGKKVYHTKGTANIIEDPVVYADQIYGVVIGKAHILSFIYKIVATKYGMLIIIIPIFYIVGSELLSIMLESEEKKRKKIKE